MLRVSLLVMQANEVISLEYTPSASVFKDCDYPVSFSTSAGTNRSSGTGAQRSASPKVETKEVPSSEPRQGSNKHFIVITDRS